MKTIPPLRLAVWSGPRNISTAMMRSWGNRSDTIVCDEPLYAHYLFVTGRDHPGAAEVIARGPVDEKEAIARLFSPLPGGKTIFFQKHMVHHLLPGMDRSWLKELAHCFLIREPERVLTSFAKHVSDPTPDDLGFAQQAALFQEITELTGRRPPVIDAADVLNNPRGILSRLCEELGICFAEQMLSWPPGPRDTDGVWAKHWYKEVENSSGFENRLPGRTQIPSRWRDLVSSCREHYKQLFPFRLRA